VKSQVHCPEVLSPLRSRVKGSFADVRSQLKVRQEDIRNDRGLMEAVADRIGRQLQVSGLAGATKMS
jgi:hypothetical protein